MEFDVTMLVVSDNTCTSGLGKTDTLRDDSHTNGIVLVAEDVMVGIESRLLLLTSANILEDI